MSCCDKKVKKNKQDGIHVPCKGRYPVNVIPKRMKAEAHMKYGDDDCYESTILRIDDINSPDFWLEVDIEEFIDNIRKKRRIINSVVGNGNVIGDGVVFGDK